MWSARMTVKVYRHYKKAKIHWQLIRIEFITSDLHIKYMIEYFVLSRKTVLLFLNSSNKKKCLVYALGKNLVMIEYK